MVTNLLQENNLAKTSDLQQDDVAPQPLPVKAMSLRSKINLIFAVVSVLVLGLLVMMEIMVARTSVREEIESTNRIADHLLGRISWLYSMGGLEQLAGFLRETGRIRANDIVLVDYAGNILYASSPSTYKAGSNAPEWYTALLTPVIKPTTIMLKNGRLIIIPDPSRAILDAWDDLRQIFLVEAGTLLLADLLIFFIVGRWLTPFVKILNALRDFERGNHQVRLPVLPGKEADEMGRTFNQMAQAVEENIQARHASAEAQARLDAQREFSALLTQRIEEERASLARELHDELGQSLTGICSIAKSMSDSPALKGSAVEYSSKMLFDAATATVDALHRMIPRLRPIQLEEMGLNDAVRDLVSEIQLAEPALSIVMQIDPLMPALPEALELSVYRIIQESLTNVIRHAKANRVSLFLRMQADDLRLTITDNGVGIPDTLIQPGHFGVRGMQERAELLGGHIVFRQGDEDGMEVDVTIPVRKVAV